ncbi:universal stress protein [Ornithinibacillus sp. L9]|uniref:Universal stress protein n=1 Tax=Ornithinibacillus caprae TaxID=2678566 RepID=A0A6N8FKX3_9BACI|nr:universal stress protein [Ornithinibacillus caprae]MUK89366.1 universal stress protein [Ornithinibacillus caprae]
MFKKILFAADGSEHSIRAGEKAFELASYNTESRVDILYVVDPKHSKDEVINSWGKDAADLRKEKLELIVQKAKQSNVDFEVVFLHGDPGPTIVDYANKHAFDAVVIGSRGLNAFQEMVLGSVSHKVAKRANCPVMIVK